MRRCNLAGATAVDIGAHRGIYSYWMHRAVGPRGRVVAFEPQPEMQAELDRAKRSFDLSNLEIVPRGLSSAAGSNRLIRDPAHTGGAHLQRTGSTQSAGAALRPAEEAIEISVTTLDEHFADYGGPPVAFIKCDVEGHEVAVFQGARRLLEQSRPTLLVEVHDRHVREGSLFRLLDGWGYEATFPLRGELVPMSEYDRVRPTIEQAYLNYVFRPSRAG